MSVREYDLVEGTASDVVGVSTGIDRPELTPAIEPVNTLFDPDRYNREGTLQLMKGISDSTGGHVKFYEEHMHFPVLIGDDDRPVSLFLFVEVLDQLIDYGAIREELPSLSYAQIAGAISFLREIAQINPDGIDIDEREAEEDEQELLNQLREGLADQEIARVLHNGD